MRTLIGIICTAGLMTLGAGMAIAQEAAAGAAGGQGRVDRVPRRRRARYVPTGSVLFTDRTYTVAECPDWLQGKALPARQHRFAAAFG